MNWYALYIKYRNEKKVAKQLADLGLKVYCPVKIQIRQWSDRKKKVETPLIPSYIFVQLEEKDRDLVFQVSGVVRYVFWLGKPAIVRNEEILILKEYLQNTRLDANLESLKPGDIFSIPTGPFKGREGIVKELDKNRIQLLLVGLGFKITFTQLQEDI